MLTAEEKIALASSAEFQKILAEDAELRELDESQIDYNVEKLLLWETLGGTLDAYGIEVSPITPAIWSFLWLSRSPLCTGAVPSTKDVAEAVFILTHSLEIINFDTLDNDARLFADKIGLNEENAKNVWKELVEIVEHTFSPLKMLPQAGNTSSNSEPVFDTDWFLSVCSIAANEANMPIREVAVHFPLSAVFGLMVIRARKANPGVSIGRHTPEYVGKRILERTNELAEDFLNNGGSR